jgi:integrase/recombinase XerC
VRLREKGGKRHAMPCDHNLEEHLVAYFSTVPGDAKIPRHRCSARLGAAPANSPCSALPQANADATIRRRAAAAAIESRLGNHSFWGADHRLSQERRRA